MAGDRRGEETGTDHGRNRKPCWGIRTLTRAELAIMGNAMSSFAVWRAHEGHNGENGLRLTWGGGKSTDKATSVVLGQT